MSSFWLANGLLLRLISTYDAWDTSYPSKYKNAHVNLSELKSFKTPLFIVLLCQRFYYATFLVFLPFLSHHSLSLSLWYRKKISKQEYLSPLCKYRWIQLCLQNLRIQLLSLASKHFSTQKDVRITACLCFKHCIVNYPLPSSIDHNSSSGLASHLVATKIMGMLGYRSLSSGQITVSTSLRELVSIEE